MKLFVVVGLFLMVGFIFAWQAISAQGDIAAPVVVDVSIEPQSIDTSGAPQVITVTATLSDDLSGINYVELQFRPSVGTTQYFALFVGEQALVDGDSLYGTYIVTHTLPQYAAEGRWEMSFAGTTDNVGNVKHYTGDSEPPIIYRYFENQGNSVSEPTPLPPSLATPVPTSVPQQPARQLFIPAVLGN